MAAPSPVSPRPPFSHSNHIDLTLDDDDDDIHAPHILSPRLAKRARTEISRQDLAPSPFLDPSSFVAPFPSKPPSLSPHASLPFVSQSPFVQHPNFMPIPNQPIYRPPFAGPAPYPTPQPQFMPNLPSRSPSLPLSSQQSHLSSSQSSSQPSSSQLSSSQPSSSQFSSSSSQPPSSQYSSSSSAPSDRHIIDLTDSPSPPPSMPSHQPPMPFLPPELPPKTPVCIGQLTVTALILYPIPYIAPLNPGETEWAGVRLQYEHTVNSANKSQTKETIHIKSPSGRTPNGENYAGEVFGVVEQKVADFLGPMLGKGLIRLDAKIRKGTGNLPILPLQMLVFTPKGNIPVVGNYLEQNNLILDDPLAPAEMQRYTGYHYFNPHSHLRDRRRAILLSNSMSLLPRRDHTRWATPASAAKSVEVQRSQVDELFKTLKDGAGLEETEPGPEIATKLYPHQKKALTFLLDREKEHGANGNHASLWEERFDPLQGRPAWYHVVTRKEVSEPPKEAKGAILADDMGLGKTISTVSLIAATLQSAEAFAASPLDVVPKPPPRDEAPDPAHFAGSVWGMPDPGASAKGKAKTERMQDKLEASYARSCRIKVKSRATLIVCPLSTVSNWEDQFREHWKGEVYVVGGSGSCPSLPSSQATSCPTPTPSLTSFNIEEKAEAKRPGRVREGRPLRVYVYHGNARRPDPSFLSDFDAVITTYATLASEFSKQSRSLMVDDDDDDDGSSDGQGGVDIDEYGNQILRLPKPKKTGTKRKKSANLQANNPAEIPSALQSIHWFRVVLDEAHSIKETSTVASRACCDLMADRRLCLTGTPVQNKLDDVFALIKFLRLEPLDDKNVWTEFIGSPVKFGQKIGVARLQTVMQCITLRRTKDTTNLDGKRILSLPPRRDELRYLKLDAEEQEIYSRFLEESKAEFNELSRKNEVMKNYVGILQKILRLRQICDHFELVQGKVPGLETDSPNGPMSYEDIVAAIAKDGFNALRAAAIFAILRESATTQCVECGGELCASAEANQADMDGDSVPTPTPAKRGRRPKGTASRGSTRANSPNTPRPVLTKCQHLFCIECYRNSICPGWPNVAPDVRRSCSVCQTGLAPEDAQEIKADPAADALQKKKVQKREKRQKGVPENFRPSTKIRALLSDLIDFSRMNPYSVNYDPEIQEVDAKGVVPMDDSQIVKTIVFSQWTSMLDKVEDALEVAGIRYDRLDGTMKREDRTKAMDALKHDPGCEVLLVSLKAGGVGLNLTAAQRVYLMDPYWNPAVENQAVDRIHRLGQTKPVTTIKFIIENSIEAKLLEVQRKKTELANMTLGQHFSKRDLLQRRLEEITHLLGS